MSRETFAEARRRDRRLSQAARNRSRLIYEWCSGESADPDDAYRLMVQFGRYLVGNGSITNDELVGWFERHAPGSAAHIESAAPRGPVRKTSGIDRDGNAAPAGLSGAAIMTTLGERLRSGVSRSMVSRAVRSGVRVAARAVSRRPVLAPADVVRERRRLCFSCPEAVPNPKNEELMMFCGRCGCSLEYKTALTTERCPLPEPRWGVVDGA